MPQSGALDPRGHLGQYQRLSLHGGSPKEKIAGGCCPTSHRISRWEGLCVLPVTHPLTHGPRPSHCYDITINLVLWAGAYLLKGIQGHEPRKESSMSTGGKGLVKVEKPLLRGATGIFLPFGSIRELISKGWSLGTCCIFLSSQYECIAEALADQAKGCSAGTSVYPASPGPALSPCSCSADLS